MDLIDRQAAIDALEKGLPSEPLKSKYTEGITVGFGLAITWIEQLPAVQPQPVVRCKDCKYWKDSDGVYRRGVDAESKCPLNIQEVYAGTFYCGYAERRTDE